MSPGDSWYSYRYNVIPENYNTTMIIIYEVNNNGLIHDTRRTCMKFIIHLLVVIGLGFEGFLSEYWVILWNVWSGMYYLVELMYIALDIF